MSSIEGRFESKKMEVGSSEALIEAAMDNAEQFVDRLQLDSKTSLRTRLLTEEVLEMVKSMTGEFSGQFWIEVEDDEFRLQLEGSADIDISKEEELMSASKDGENISVKGFGAKLTQFIRHQKEYVSDLFTPDPEFVPVMNDYLYIGEMGSTYGASDFMWSMRAYRDYLYAEENYNEQVEEDRDELEKSILANLADDVKVGVLGDQIRMIVIKKI